VHVDNAFADNSVAAETNAAVIDISTATDAASSTSNLPTYAEI
jgi:hypothetical protein